MYGVSEVFTQSLCVICTTVTTGTAHGTQTTEQEALAHVSLLSAQDH